MAREGSINLFLGPKPAPSISSGFGGLMIREWLKEKHFKHQAATQGMRQSSLFSEGTSNELSQDLLALDEKQCRLVTELLTGHCT
jgi:hypothetical protein